MAVRTIIQIGDTRLKAKNKEVNDFSTLEIKKVIRDLKDTMNKIGLIGIAAPQIGENYKIFITHPRSTAVRRINTTDKLRVYINPKIMEYSKVQTIIWEGCGCMGIKDFFFGPVRRPAEITVRAYDENGKAFQLRCDGILARVIQHEYDHLLGKEFIEKVTDYHQLMHKMHYTKIIKYSPEQVTASKITILEHKSLPNKLPLI